MEASSPRRPEELLYRMGQNTRAMNAFFSLEETERRAILARTAGADTAQQAEDRMEKELTRLEALGSEYGRSMR